MPDGVIALPPFTLPDRWTPLRWHSEQHAYWHSPHRFNVVPAGRRSGKTERLKRKLVKRAIAATTRWTPRFFAGAPTRDQAKFIFWEDLKALSPKELVLDISESHLMIKYVNFAEVYVVGLDKPQRIEGQPWDGGGLDEYGNMRPEVWTANVRPALSDRLGWCDLIGVPEGRNHYYELYRKASAEMSAKGRDSEWGAFHWISADILPASEIESAKNDLDELTYQQEYEASFVNFEGRCYYPFDERIHCAPLAKKYNPRAPLILMLDFNVEPGVAAIGQEMTLPNGKTGTVVFAEIHIPRNSNTPAVCRKFVAMFGPKGEKHLGPVRIYGDSTGGNRGTAKVMGSDWELVAAEITVKDFPGGVTQRVKTGSPRERARINAVNTRLKTSGGVVQLMVDPKGAPNVVKDFEGVVLLKGGSGEIDKKATPALTHLSDAVSYYIEYEFPVTGAGIQRVQLSGV